jgi:peroxiredoxin/predicted 2-oxoglutarate/Fe(II)-dependent dioxygenase YbiX
MNEAVNKRRLLPGDAVPWFRVRATSSENFTFATIAGRYIVLCFFGSAGRDATRGPLESLLKHAELFDDARAHFFGVSCDPKDESEKRVEPRIPGIRYFWDFNGNVSEMFGALERATGRYHPITLVIDPNLRVLTVIPFRAGEDHGDAVASFLKDLPPPGLHAGLATPAPVLVMPRIFEPEFCRDLIQYYQAQGGQDSGFMREVEGRTVGVIDYSHKRRSDCLISDPALKAGALQRIVRRLIPEIQKAFQFRATRLERYIVACYETEPGGYFRPHRDNTTKGTAHRRFAVTINLNAGDYEGGDLRFPEFGPQTYRAPTGGAVVFSCSLLHEAMPMTRGTRYAFLPFLYDDAAARQREENAQFLAEGLPKYRADAGVPAPEPQGVPGEPA